MNLESWIIQLLDSIQSASLDNKSFTLSLNAETVKEITKAYDNTEWIEIY